MSEDAQSAMLDEGDAAIARHNENQESLPDSSGEGDTTSPIERSKPSAIPPGAKGPAQDINIETPSRAATSPSVEADAEADPQAPGKA